MTNQTIRMLVDTTLAELTDHRWEALDPDRQDEVRQGLAREIERVLAIPTCHLCLLVGDATNHLGHMISGVRAPLPSELARVPS